MPFLPYPQRSSPCVLQVECHSLSRLIAQLTHDEIGAMMVFMDVDGNQSIDFHEFAMGILEEEELISEAKLRLAFDYFDSDHNGYIDLGIGPMLISNKSLRKSYNLPYNRMRCSSP